MQSKKRKNIVFSSQEEKNIEGDLLKLLKCLPLPDSEILANLGLFLTSKNLARILFFYEIYQKISQIHGIIVEFGARWGQTLSVMSALRGIFEPFNRHRKIVGFDTFGGFKGINKKDGLLHKCAEGAYAVPPGYQDYLARILAIQEKLNPLPHLVKYELIKGDAIHTVPAYFKKHPETIIALAIFDFDIYTPTKTALKAILPNLCKGSILVFDELCDEIFPGETIALKETLGLNNVKVQRLAMTSRISYLEIK